jgi:hypothetical protein
MPRAVSWARMVMQAPCFPPTAVACCVKHPPDPTRTARAGADYPYIVIATHLSGINALSSKYLASRSRETVGLEPRNFEFHDAVRHAHKLTSFAQAHSRLFPESAPRFSLIPSFSYPTRPLLRRSPIRATPKKTNTVYVKSKPRQKFVIVSVTPSG